MVATERVNFLFADGRALYGDALEMLVQGKIRNPAEKAWGATKRATDGVVLPWRSSGRLWLPYKLVETGTNPYEVTAVATPPWLLE